jgi:uncharacterized protein YbjT (DUF2867 family)
MWRNMEPMEFPVQHQPVWRHDRRRFLQALAVVAGTAGTLKASGTTDAAASRETSSRPVSGSGVIVVTAPLGNIGRQLLEHLLQGSSRIRVIERDPSRLPANVRERVEVVEGSHAESSVVDEAFRGADTVFWLCPPDPRAESLEKAYLEFTRPACEAIRRHGVERVVSVSALGRGTPMAKRAGYVTASLAMDDMLAGTGAHFRALAMPSFMDNMLRQVEAISTQGVFFSPVSGDLKAPTCATRDIAAVAAKLLLDRSWTGQGSVPVLGPEDLSFNDMARIMSEVLGRRVRFQQIFLQDFKANLRRSGMSEAMAQGMADMMAAKGQGLDNAEPRTPEATTPTTFRQWATEVLKPAVLEVVRDRRDTA